MSARKKPNEISFALVDIKRNRHALAKLVRDHKQKIPITLTGYLTGQWSGDDGTSIELEMNVETSKLGKPVKHDCTCCICKPIKPKARA